MEKIIIDLFDLKDAEKMNDEFSAFTVHGYLLEEGDTDSLFCLLLFVRLFDNTYDLICAAVPETERVYVCNLEGLEKMNDPTMDYKLIVKFLYTVYTNIDEVEFFDMNRVDLRTPCGDMGTVIDVKIVEKARNNKLFFDDIFYLRNEESCWFCDSKDNVFEVHNINGTYYVLEINWKYDWSDNYTHEIFTETEATAEIKAKVRLV